MPTPKMRTTASPRPTVPPHPANQFEALFRQVEQLRGLTLQTVVAYRPASAAQVDQAAQAALLSDWTATFLTREARILQSFGLIEPPMDSNDLAHIIGLRPAAVARTPTGLLISTALSTEDPAILQLVCAYHRWLLTSAHPDGDPFLEAETCLTDTDQCLARRALLAGDAALLAEQWARTFGDIHPAPEASPACGHPFSAEEMVSPGLAPTLRFPEQSGLEFTRFLYLKSGWAGIDLAYTDPPASTEQVLHPERYPRDTPRPPVYPDPASSLGEGWTTDEIGTLGEWRTLLVLEAHLDPDTSRLAAEGWDGDQYALLSNAARETHALVLLTRWDTVRDAHEFSGAFRIYGEARYGRARREGTALSWAVPSGLVVLDIRNDQTLWVEAPDAALAASLRKAAGFPLY